jgi:hypothetical protein
MAVAHSAAAGLGGQVESVEADRVRFAARMSSTVATGYAVHMLRMPNGGVVREFTRPDGMVFAVAWRGPGRPDLRQLLGGPLFDRFQADNVMPAGRRTHMPLAASHADFVVQTGGRPGAFWGVAFLPQAAPTGFSPSSLR